MVTKTKKMIMSRLLGMGQAKGKVKGRAIRWALQLKSSEFVCSYFFSDSLPFVLFSSLIIWISIFTLHLHFPFLLFWSPPSFILVLLHFFSHSSSAPLFLPPLYLLSSVSLFNILSPTSQHLTESRHSISKNILILSDVIRSWRTFSLIIWKFLTTPRKIAYANMTGRGVPENEEDEDDEDAGEEEDDEEVIMLYGYSHNHRHNSKRWYWNLESVESSMITSIWCEPVITLLCMIIIIHTIF